MSSNSILVNMINSYISSGIQPAKTHFIYPAFINEWRKKWKDGNSDKN